jgi:glycosyltransferase involved in cell wall biosynthesis
VAWIARHPRSYLRAKLRRARAARGPRVVHTPQGDSAAHVHTSLERVAAGALQPSESDILVSCGSDWEGKDVYAILEAKERHRFSYVSVCYDVIPWKHPEYWPRGVAEKVVAYHAEAAWLADLVMCISRTTAREYGEFCAELDVPCPELRVFRLGDHKPSSRSDGRVPRALVGSRYVLLVAAIEPRKNHRLLYHVWDELVRDPAFPTDVKLVFVGSGRWMTGDLLQEIELNRAIDGRLVVLDRLDDADLEALYDGCLFTVYPSFDEGWGLPVVESMSHGKVCVASNRGGIPEIGPHTMLLDPHDFGRWRETVSRFVIDDDARARLEDRIRHEFEPREWKDSADEFFRTLSSVVGSR